MNIGIVTVWTPTGGGYVSKAYREVLSKEHNVFIYARGGERMKGDPIWDDDKLTWGTIHYNGLSTSHLLKWAKKRELDVIFFNEQRYWKPIVELKKAGYILGSYIDYYTQKTVRAFGLYDFIICNTKRHYSVFNWHPECFYIPWGTDISKFKPQTSAKKRPLTFLMNLGWEGSHTYDRKGLLLALRAFANVKGSCRLLLYSQTILSEFLYSVKELIERDDRIRFIEGTFDPFPYYDGDVYLYPSRLDGIGLSLPEAISSGLPAITTNNPPMNEFVQNSTNGFLVDVEEYLGRYDGYYWAESMCDINSLTKTLQYYLNNQDKLLEQKAAARIYAENNLNWQNNSFELSTIFSNAKNLYAGNESELVSYAFELDRVMAPSFWYRQVRIIYDYVAYLYKRVISNL